MEIAQIVWLVTCGIVIIAGFSLGSYYLSEWKDACINYAKYTAKARNSNETKSGVKYESEIAENLVQKQICFPVWSISFLLVFVFLGIVAFTLFK